MASSDGFADARTRMQALLGHELDAFQQEALDVVTSGDDLLGMAPTGSGKTALALMGVVLRAFDRGGRAVLTSPIKALSNQKYAEFSRWLSAAGWAGRVTLLTGDIQVNFYISWKCPHHPPPFGRGMARGHPQEINSLIKMCTPARGQAPRGVRPGRPGGPQGLPRKFGSA